MRQILKHNDIIHNIEYTNEEQLFHFILDEKEKYNIQINKISENHFLIYHNDQTINAYIVSEANEVYVSLNGNQYNFSTNIDEDEGTENPSKISDSNIQIVKPPMPGNIIKINCEAEAKVQKGDTLLIIEAMKMEVSLRSNFDGTVSEVNVKPGDIVQTDKILMVVEKG